MSGHTPGPWVADDFCEESFQLTRVGTCDGSPHYYHRSATIAYCMTNHDDDRDEGVPAIGIINAEANARLIAAAPDMLKALIAVVRVADRQTDEFEMARAAIAKATTPNTPTGEAH